MSLDFFDFFRLALAWVVTIYASVVTLQSLWGWHACVSAPNILAR